MDDVEGKAECDAAWTHVDCYGDVGRDNELAGSGDNGGVNDKLSPPSSVKTVLAYIQELQHMLL